MRFTNAYLTISSCSPSRASIITGTYPTSPMPSSFTGRCRPPGLTFVELLKASGYWTAAAGKWHLGNAVKDRFDEIRKPSARVFSISPRRGGQSREDCAERHRRCAQRLRPGGCHC
ncbi:MAG: hypothetical protein CM1200mP29_02730 [Verrucomicrobiota bacterium]|nr:MAG: hypothetical protein CM1200mP29_02730 [Verrucomicrobiota bacterium]